MSGAEHGARTPHAYPDLLEIAPLQKMPDARIVVPGSKSITNRALILAALSNGRVPVENALFSEDTLVLMESLRRLGIPVEADATARRIVVEGQGGRIPAREATLFAGNSGTSLRFLTALVCLGEGRYRLDGTARMRERPQAALVAALRGLGADVTAEGASGGVPLLVTGKGGLEGGETGLCAEASSQFLTALLMVAPFMRRGVTLHIEGTLRPAYVEMTCRMMAAWGVPVIAEEGLFRVAAAPVYRAPAPFIVEPDASSASYFFAAAAVTGGRVTVPGLGPDSLQGDIRFATETLAAMGCRVTAGREGATVIGPDRLAGVDRDMSAFSDTTLTLAAIAPFASESVSVRNIAHSRLQECDRIAAACAELGRLGVRVEERPDGFTVHPSAVIRPAVIETYQDHRVAMGFALVGLKAPGITIQNPGCVAKTFPDYWECLEALRR